MAVVCLSVILKLKSIRVQSIRVQKVLEYKMNSSTKSTRVQKSTRV